MKKILSIAAVLVFVLTSCTGVIDQKIVLTDYEENIEKVKEKHPEYSDADFSKASHLLDALAFKSMAAGNGMKTDKTYRELLDEAKKENEKEEAERQAYFDELKKLKDVVSVEFRNGSYSESEDPFFFGVSRNFSAEVTITNHSDKLVTGIEGEVEVKNNAGKSIKTCFIKYAGNDLLPAGDVLQESKTYSVLEHFDNIMELKAVSSDMLQYEWLPNLIIFADGSRMEAPKKPYHLFEE